jgi:tetratricopeptide (TPR) repeat protein
MSGVAPTDVTGHPASQTLFAAWQSSGFEQRQDLLRGIRAPGPIALRARYRHLLDPEAPAGPWDADWPVDRWDEVIRLETAGDDAVHGNDVSQAEAVFLALRARETSASHRVLTVHAHLGFGDIGLARDDAEVAAGGYEAALTLAISDGYRFGQLRALVGLGYVTLIFHSAGAALDLFTQALALARVLGDPGYAGNAALGVAECQERLGHLDQAVGHAEQAYRDFDGIGAVMGRGNAAQRLGAMMHRQGERAAARSWLERARIAFAEAGNPMGMTNVLSGLGDLLLDEGDPDGAEQTYLESLRAAEAADLPRSRAHALQDLARVARSRADWPAAMRGFSRSLAAYREIGELLGASNAADKLAEAYARLDQPGSVLQVRMDAVFAIEEYRATHSDERSQREYRDRFAGTYAAALAAATDCGAAAAFAVVADCLAGRRLAGLFLEASRASAGSEQLTLLQELLVRADQRWVTQTRPGQDVTGRRERVVRLLGAVSIKHGLAPQAEASLDDLLATVYMPPEDEGEALLAALPSGCDVLQLLVDPQDRSLLRWLWRDTAGAVQVGVTALSDDAVGLLKVLQEDSAERFSLRAADLGPLAELLPPGLSAWLAVGGGHRLVLIPVGALWFVPWSAVPLGGVDRPAGPGERPRLLGQAAAYAVRPSLTVQRQLAGRGAPGRGPAPQRADLWRSPAVRQHNLTGFLRDPAWQVTVLPSAARARERLRMGGEVMVVTGHGRPAPGLGHYLELDRDAWLLPVDLIGAQPPRRLVLIACWGAAVPGTGPTDPLSLATLALAAGSSEILATVGELGDSELATLYMEKVLAGLAASSLPDALHAASSWLLSDPAVDHEPIHHWAPLVPFGTLY